MAVMEARVTSTNTTHTALHCTVRIIQPLELPIGLHKSQAKGLGPLKTPGVSIANAGRVPKGVNFRGFI